jgi:hypothetical protein
MTAVKNCYSHQKIQAEYQKQLRSLNLKNIYTINAATFRALSNTKGMLKVYARQSLQPQPAAMAPFRYF